MNKIINDFTAMKSDFFDDDEFWNEDVNETKTKDRYDEVNISFENQGRYDEVFSDHEDHEEIQGILPFFTVQYIQAHSVTSLFQLSFWDR